MIDLTDPKSFDSLTTWKKNFFLHCNTQEESRFPLIIIGNKSDLEEKRQVSRKDVEDWCEESGGFEYIETSAKEHSEVEDLFFRLVKKGLLEEN